METDEPFNKLHATWSQDSNSETCPPQMAARRAAILLGCYRTGDANDPDTYCAAIAAVLSRYSKDVVTYVTDPRTGIAGECKWLPAVAEVKEACVKRQAYLDRLRDFDKRFANRKSVPCLPPRDRKAPGARADVCIDRSAPQYSALLEWTKTADAIDWKFDGKGELWVTRSALQMG